MKKYLSIISLPIALFLTVLEVISDVEEITDFQNQSNDSFTIHVVAGAGLFIFIQMILGLIPLTLSIIGFYMKNRYRKLALFYNIFSFIYVLIPLGFLLSIIDIFI